MLGSEEHVQFATSWPRATTVGRVAIITNRAGCRSIALGLMALGLLMTQPRTALARGTPLACDTPVSGTITASKPIDLYEFPVSVEGESVRVNVQDADPQGAAFNSSWRLRDQTGDLVLCAGFFGVHTGGADCPGPLDRGEPLPALMVHSAA